MPVPRHIHKFTRKMRSHLLAESLGPASQTATRGLSGHRMVKNVNSTAKFLVPADHGPQAHHLKLPSFISSSLLVWNRDEHKTKSSPQPTTQGCAVSKGSLHDYKHEILIQDLPNKIHFFLNNPGPSPPLRYWKTPDCVVMWKGLIPNSPTSQENPTWSLFHGNSPLTPPPHLRAERLRVG